MCTVLLEGGIGQHDGVLCEIQGISVGGERNQAEPEELLRSTNVSRCSHNVALLSRMQCYPILSCCQ
jgi:hypothetical protein